MAGGGGGGTSVTIPEYKKPTAQSFSLGNMMASNNGGGWNFNVGGIDGDTMNQAKRIRQQLMGSLGVSDTNNVNAYQNTLFKELLSKSQPQLENSLIGRGMGRSSVYTNALNDLISKASIQSILGGQQFQSNDQAMKLNNLNALQSYLQNQDQMGLNMLNQASGYDIQNQQLAQQLYNMQLPYLAQVNEEGDSGLGGALSGAISGGMAGAKFGPWGALGGAALGGGMGYMGSKSKGSSTPFALYGKGGQKSSGGGMMGGMGGMDLGSLMGLLKMGGGGA